MPEVGSGDPGRDTEVHQRKQEGREITDLLIKTKVVRERRGNLLEDVDQGMLNVEGRSAKEGQHLEGVEEEERAQLLVVAHELMVAKEEIKLSGSKWEVQKDEEKMREGELLLFFLPSFHPVEEKESRTQPREQGRASHPFDYRLRHRAVLHQAPGLGRGRGCRRGAAR